MAETRSGLELRVAWAEARGWKRVLLRGAYDVWHSPRCKNVNDGGEYECGVFCARDETYLPAVDARPDVSEFHLENLCVAHNLTWDLDRLGAGLYSCAIYSQEVAKIHIQEDGTTASEARARAMLSMLLQLQIKTLAKV